MDKKKIIKISIFIILALMILIIFILINKKNKIGNNINSQEMESNILNTNYYELIADIEIKSNKNQNKYVIKQKYQKNEKENNIETEQEVLEPSNIAGVKIIKQNNKLIIENTNLDLKSIYENYNYISDNNLDLITFIEEYKNDNNKIYKTEKEKLIMKVKNKTLYIDKKTNKPIKMEIQDANKNIAVYILYREVSFKN